MSLPEPSLKNGTASERDAAAVATALATQRPNGSDRRRAFIPRPVNPKLKTHHKVVDALYSIVLRGLIIDWNWLHATEFKTEKTGKPNLTDILVFANLVDWHRPIKETRILENGEPETYGRKKFDQPYFVTTYARLGRALGLSARQAEDAIERLLKGGSKDALIGKRPATDEERQDWKEAYSGNEKPIVVWPIPSKVRAITGRGDIPNFEMKDSLKTGNTVVDEFWTIALRGDVIDFNWLVHPALRAGKKKNLNIPALFTFANIFFLYTPTILTDPKTGEHLPWRTKFDGDTLTKSYELWSQIIGLTVDQLKDAVKFLFDAGIIKREIGTIMLEGLQARSVPLVFITPIVAGVLDLTFGPVYKDQKTNRRSPDQVGARKCTQKNSYPSLFSEEFDPESASEKSGTRYSSNGTASEKSGAVPAKKSAQCQRKKSPFIETPVGAMHRNQQQQAHQSAASFGGGGSSAFAEGESSTLPTEVGDLETEIVQRRKAVIEKLLSFETGCSSDAIRRAAHLRLEHAEMWAEWWPAQPESDESWWFDRPKGSPAAGLFKRLNDPAQIPPQVRTERARQKRREEAAEKRREEREAREAAEAESRAVFAYQRKLVADALHRFASQPDAIRRAAIEGAKCNQFLVDRSPRKDLKLLVERALDGGIHDDGIMFALANELGNALDAALQESPPLPGFEQRAAGEVADELFDDESPDDECFDDKPCDERSLLEKIRAGVPLVMVDELVRELARDLRDGMLAADELDQHRPSLYELDEWIAIKERVVKEASQ